MPFVDKTGPGKTWDKEKMLAKGSYTSVAFRPKLQLKGAQNGEGLPWIINGIECGWCVFNKCFKPIQMKNKSEQEDKYDKYEFIENPDMDAIKVAVNEAPVFSLMEIMNEYHRLRNYQNEELPEGETQKEEGLLSLIRFLGYRYSTPTTLRVMISKKNKELIDLYNSNKKLKNGNKEAPGNPAGGWFEYDYPQEFMTADEQKKAGYSPKLMKGLYLHETYRKPTKIKPTQDKFTPEESEQLLAWLTAD